MSLTAKTPAKVNLSLRVRGPDRTGYHPLQSLAQAIEPFDLLCAAPAEDDRLEIRTVRLGLIQPELVVVEQGLRPGERVVVSDIIPAIEGMLLEPRSDEALESRLRALATAQGK